MVQDGIKKDDNRPVEQRIYWFQRRKDGEYIAIDHEKNASIYIYQKTYRQNFKYVGWSDGKIYRSIVAKMKKLTIEEFNQMVKTKFEEAKKDSATNQTLGGGAADTAPVEYGLDEARSLLLKQAYSEEVKVAIANPDKTPPRNFQVVDMDGKPVTSGIIPDLIKMMSQNENGQIRL